MSDSINKLIEQAKNGNIEALTTLINTKLKAKGIIAKTSIKSQLLNIMLESKSTLPQKPLVEFLHNSLQNFQHESWLSVRVYCKKSGEDIPDWVEVFTIRSDSEEELKKLASQGDIKAIKKLLDNKFKDSKFSFKISIKENKINILFEGEDVGDEDQLSELIKSDINSYQIKEIDHVKIYAKKIGEDFPEWQRDIVLEPVLIFIESQSGKNVEQAKSIDGIEFSNKIYETLDINCYKHLVQKVNLEDNKTIHEIAEDFVEDMEKFLEKDLEQTYKEIIKVFEQFNLNLNKEEIKVIFNENKEDVWNKIHSLIRDLERVTRDVLNTDFPEETDALKAFFSRAAELAGGLNGKSLTNEAIIGASLGAFAGPLGSIVGGAIGGWIGNNNQQKILEALLDKYQKARENIFDEWSSLLEQIYIQLRSYLIKMTSIDILTYKEISKSIDYLLEGNNSLNESPEKAIDFFEKALKINPGLAMAWNNKAWAYNAIEKFEESIIASHKAMSLDPELELAPCNYGNSLYNLDRFEEALIYYDKSITIKETYDAWFGKANCHYDLHRYEDFKDVANKLIILDPEIFWGWLMLSNYYALSGDTDKALDNLTKSFELDEESSRNIVKDNPDFDCLSASEEFSILIDSSLSISYKKLKEYLANKNWQKEYLANKNWQEADKETSKVIKQIICELTKIDLELDEVDLDDVDYEMIKYFPEVDLNTINLLWLINSEGKFGFSIQKEIFERFNRDRDEFGLSTGWRRRTSDGAIWIKNPNFVYDFDKNKIGHLPSALWAGEDSWLGNRRDRLEALFDRINECQLDSLEKELQE